MNTPIVITGCQRSGTTLLHLVLDSHPLIHGVDEDEFEEERRHDYLHSPDYHPFVSFKLPRVAYNPKFVENLPGASILWCVRDPRDVVASMMQLRLPVDDGSELPWAAHPHGADYALHFSYPALPWRVRFALSAEMRRFKRIKRKDRQARTRQDLVFTGALVWRVKNELLRLFAASDVPLKIVRYEDVIARPRRELADVLGHLNIAWHDNVLKHHVLHSGVSIGGTENTRPIDAGSSGKWRNRLTDDDVSIVSRLCAATAADFGYKL